MLFDEHAPYRVFLHDLQGAEAANARRQVAAMFSDPLRTRIQDQTVPLGDPQQFRAHYAEIHQDARGDLAAVLGPVRPCGGVVIGTGQIWFSGIRQDASCRVRTVRIIAFSP